MKPITTELFSYDKTDRVMTACASDGPLHGLFRPGGLIPSKLQLESHRTGNVVEFEYAYKETTAENEVSHWAYYNDYHNITVLIFND